MPIRRIFDIIGPKGFIPNGINWNNTDMMWDYNFFITHDFINKFNNVYTQVSVYDCNLNIGECRDIHIGELVYNSTQNIIENNTNENFYYTIHPFGNSGIANGIDISYHEGQHCFDFISKKAIEYSKAKNFYFIFDYSSEGCIDGNLFESIHKACERTGINASKVIVITAAMNTYDIYKEYLDNQPKSPKNLLYTTFYPWSLLAKSKDTEAILFQDNIVNFNGNKNVNSLMKESDLDLLTNRSKKSLCLNRRLAPHRLILISYLIDEGLFDETNTSFDIKMLYTPDAGFDLINGSGFDDKPYMTGQDFINKIIKGFRTLVKKEKNVLDYDNIWDVWGFGFESAKLYKETYFSITTETLFYEAGDYISEKTFKPFQHLHPFVLIGRPGVLKYLQSLGFKTFADYWDESYDDIEDNSLRMQKVLGVIKTLINKTNEEWDVLNEELKPILIHNRNNLLSYDAKKVGNCYIKNLNTLIKNEPNQKNYHLL
jgi:Ca2+-binding EF-hand superfamily protein|tara:strand:- start:191 stop:1648 length:1458 start_codon:yes stop_codon:yes gene_type:complete